MDDFILLLVGIAGLWGGTELAVVNAIKLARNLKVSELFIGLTILAFGTDLPEVVVSVNGALLNLQGTDTSGIISGNAIGSSISQISLVMGVTGLFHYLAVGKLQIRYLAIELIGSVIILMLVAFDNVITWNDGVLMIMVFLIYFFTHLQRERKEAIDKIQKRKSAKNKTALTILLLVIGLGILGFSSDLTITHALNIAEIWGIQQSFIGAVIIGLGTSLPELAVSVNAVLKKKPHLSIGNIIGSNIFDLLMPLGLAALIADIKIENQTLWFDLPILLVISVVVIWFLSKKRGLQKWEGVGLAMFYIGYAIGKFLIT